MKREHKFRNVTKSYETNKVEVETKILFLSENLESMSSKQHSDLSGITCPDQGLSKIDPVQGNKKSIGLSQPKHKFKLMLTEM